MWVGSEKVCFIFCKQDINYLRYSCGLLTVVDVGVVDKEGGLWYYPTMSSFSLNKLVNHLDSLVGREFGGKFEEVVFENRLKKLRLIYSFLVGNCNITTRLINENGKFKLIVIDIDTNWDFQKVVLFQRMLFDIFQIKSFSGPSSSGYIHVYIPIMSGMDYERNKFILKILEEMAKKFFDTSSVEVFPNGRPIRVFVSGVLYDYLGNQHYGFGFKDRGKLLSRILYGDFSNSVSALEKFARRFSSFRDVFDYFISGNDVDFSEDADYSSLARELVKEVSKDYVRGERNNLIFELSGLFAMMNISLAESLTILSPLMSNDEQRKERGKLIYRAYYRKREGKKLYFSGLLSRYPTFYKIFVRLKRIDTIELEGHFLKSIHDILGQKASKYQKIIDDVKKKIRKYGSVFVLGYNALSKLGYSKRDISTFLNTCVQKGLFRRILVGRYTYLGSEKISMGSVYKLVISNSSLDENKVDKFVYRMSIEMRKIVENLNSYISDVVEFFVGRLMLSLYDGKTFYSAKT